MIEVNLNPYPWQTCSECKMFMIKNVEGKGLRYFCMYDSNTEVEESWGEECEGFVPKPYFALDLYTMILMEAEG